MHMSALLHTSTPTTTKKTLPHSLYLIIIYKRHFINKNKNKRHKTAIFTKNMYICII